MDISPEGWKLYYLTFIGIKELGDRMPFRETLQQFNQPRHSFFIPKNDVTDGPSSPVSPTSDFWKPKTAGKMKVKPLYPDQDYEQIVRRLRAGGGGRLFEDERFPSHNSLLADNSGGDIQIISYFGRRQVRPSEMRWMRPSVSL